jgi:hypothetical protein
VFRKLALEADGLELKYPSVQASAFLEYSLVHKRDYEHARQELERTMPEAEKLKLRSILAQDHHLLGTVLRLSGHGSEAASHYRDALRYLDQIRQDTGADAVLQRSDLNTIYTESNRWLKG